MARNTISTRRTIFASLLALGVAGGAQAQAIGNVVGGGSATLTGGGDNAQVTYSAGGAGGGGTPVQSGRSVTFAGGDGDGGSRWNYGAPPDGNPGREAWMTGGGDNAQVVYASPHQRR